MASGSRAAKFAVYGFAAIFCMIGLGILYAAINTIEEGDTTKTILLFLAALAFGGFGLGVLLLTRAGFRRQAREEELQAAYPGEPWKWRDDWESGRIQSSAATATRFLWVFAILWNLISTPMLLVLLPEEIIEKENYGALIGLLFPLVGVGLIIAAVRKTIQAKKFGRCLFLMEQVPGVLGGEVAGTLVVPRGLTTAESISIGLTCIHEITRRSGKSTSTDEHVLWQAEKTSVQFSPTGEGTALGARIRFKIPYDTKPTGRIDENERIFWKLEANAAVPGVDFATVFELPVYLTQSSSAQNTEESLRTEALQAEAPVFSPADQTAVSIVPSEGGGTEFVLRPTKGGSSLSGALILIVVFGGIGTLLGYVGAPFLFPLIFGGIALLIVFLLVFSAFGESRIVVEDGHVSVRNSLFGIMRGRRMPCSSITKISVSGESRAGKRGYFSVILTRNDGKTASPLQSLPDKALANWLAEEVRKAMEPWRSKERLEEKVLN